VQNGSMS